MDYDELNKALDKLEATAKPVERPKPKVTVNIRLDEKIVSAIDRYARGADLTRSQAIRKLIELGFEFIIEQQKNN